MQMKYDKHARDKMEAYNVSEEQLGRTLSEPHYTAKNIKDGEHRTELARIEQHDPKRNGRLRPMVIVVIAVLTAATFTASVGAGFTVTGAIVVTVMVKGRSRLNTYKQLIDKYNDDNKA